MPDNPRDAARTELATLAEMSLADALGQDCQLLTPNIRLTRRFLVQAVHLLTPSLQREALPRPRVLHFSAWLNRGCEHAILTGAALSPDLQRRQIGLLEERRLWHLVIQESAGEDPESLLDLEAAASLASRTHHLILHWDLSLDRDYPDLEVQRFLDWRQRYQESCEHLAVIDSATRLRRLTDALDAGDLRIDIPADGLLLCGFLELTRLEAKIVACLQRQGALIRRLPETPSEPVTVVPWAIADADTEVRAAATWAQEQCRAGARQILIGVPDLQARHAEFERIFRQTLNPKSAWSLHGDRQRQWNLHTAIPLSEVPAIEAALRLLALILRLRGKTLSKTDLAALIRAPGLGASQREQCARARLEVRLRGAGRRHWPLHKFLAWTEGWDSAAEIPTLVAPIRLLLDLHARPPVGLSPVAWLDEALRRCGWPGDLGLAPGVEQDLARCFQQIEALHRLAPFRESGAALTALRNAANLARIEFGQLELAPIQILDLHDASQQCFDAVWILGLSEGAWPQSARPDPFLPYTLQRSIPHLRSETKLEHARKLLDSIHCKPGQMVLSFPQRDGDQELQPAPVLGTRQYKTAGVQPLPISASSIRQAFGHTLRKQTDDRGPALQINPGEILPHGVSWLNLQALCPLLAFIRFRLHAGELPRLEIDPLDPANRGQLVHDALQHFWRHTEGLHQLSAMSTEQRAQRLSEAADQALTRLQRRLWTNLPAGLLRLEKTRLLLLLEAGLERDMRRKPFRIEAIELDVKLQVGPLRMTGRIDRLDRLPDNKLLIIDYKTSARGTAPDWDGDRLLAPQLPLYALHQPDARGALFLHLHLRYPGWSGTLTPDASDLPAAGRQVNTYPNWNTLLQGWHSGSELLATEILEGRAADRVYDERALRFQPERILLRTAEHQGSS